MTPGILASKIYTKEELKQEFPPGTKFRIKNELNPPCPTGWETSKYLGEEVVMNVRRQERMLLEVRIKQRNLTEWEVADNQIVEVDRQVRILQGLDDDVRARVEQPRQIAANREA